jgi:hypothetical protein
MLFFIFGIRSVRIGRFFDNNHICYPCKAYDKEILVYRSYFHLCLIPVFPVGPRRFEIRCRNCGDETKSENILKEYEGKARTPIYFYSAWLVFVSVAALWYFWNNHSQRNKMEFVSNPKIGDVFTIKQTKNDGTSYYFLKIIEVNRDSIKAFHNNLDYGDFVARLDKDDYFVKDDTLAFKRNKLQRMLNNDEIFEATRNYGEVSGFNRVQ